MTRVLLLVIAAYLLDIGILQPLSVNGLAPDLGIHVVVAAACAGGPVFGATAGFASGILLDIAPSSAHPAGIGALAFTLAGHVVGLIAAAPWSVVDQRWARAARVVGLTAACSLVVATTFAAMNALVGGGGIEAGELATAPAVAVLTAALAPFVVPPLVRLIRR